LIANQLEILEQNCYSFLKVYFHHWRSGPLILSITTDRPLWRLLASREAMPRNGASRTMMNDDDDDQ